MNNITDFIKMDLDKDDINYDTLTDPKKESLKSKYFSLFEVITHSELSNYKRKLISTIELFTSYWPNLCNIEKLIQYLPSPFSLIEERDIISLDIETSGVNENKNGILSIGAINLRTGQTFYRECKLYEFLTYHEKALEVNGFTLEEIYDESKSTSWEIIGEFYLWYLKNDGGLIIGQNLPSFDMRFIDKEFTRNHTRNPFGYHYLDLHTLIYGETKRSLSLANGAKYFEVKEEPTPHNALEGAKCCGRIVRKILKIK